MYTQFLQKLTNTLGTLLLLLTACALSAQSDVVEQQALTYLQQHQTELGLSARDIAELPVSNYYTDAHSGVAHLYMQQHANGIPIENAVFGFHSRGDEVIYVANGLQKKLTTRLQGASPAISAEAALRTACAEHQLPTNTRLSVLTQTNDATQLTLFAKGQLSLHDIPVRLAYLPTQNGEVRLAWRVEIYTDDANHYWVTHVDAQNDNVLAVQDLVIHCEFDHDHGATDAHGHDYNLTPKTATVTAPTTVQTAEKTNNSGHFYRVYDTPIETPNHGDRTMVFTNGDPVASPYGWHYDGTVNYLITRGNNVYAYEDQSGANAGAPAVGGINPLQPLNFDFPLDLTQQPDTYTDAAVTNLFYWNNKIHDILYHYGFTEAAGNFQQDNLGRGGLGNDGVMAEAQDGGGTNNANFLTLPDGAPGRMQMYLWSSNATAELAHIESSPSFPNGGVSYEAIQAAFGADIDQNGFAGELTLVEANVDSYSDCNSCGCGIVQDPVGVAGVPAPPANDVVGKIVLIDRGDCAFTEKVLGAQLGGAIGVVVANNIPGADPIAMGGGETSGAEAITIPAVMITFENGAALKSELAAGTVQFSLRRDTPIPPFKDGDLDNGIIAHEYGHGVSIRLTGGPNTTCLGGEEQAGEGWSDYFALMTTMDAATLADGGYAGRGIGTYVRDQPTSGLGIRPARYSRDLAVNPYTYGHLNNAEITVPHGIGFIFATALWDMTWNLIDTYGYNPDLVNGTIASGNILALQLVMDGLKLQPCSPTFLQSRDAILAADQALTGGANQCLIWEAFAKRGMGFSAVSGTNSRGDEQAAFDLPPTCQPQLLISQTADKTQAANGETITYTIEVTNVGNGTAKNIRVTDPLADQLVYVSNSGGSLVANNTVRFPKFNLGANESRTLTFQATVDSDEATNVVFFDDLEDGQNQWSALTGLNAWTLQNAKSFSGDFAWFAADPDNISNQLLMLASEVTLPAGAELHFQHLFNTESGFDGGVIEISNDGGATWYDLGGQVTENGYNDHIPVANNALIDGFAFGGSSNGWIKTVVDLGLFGGQTVNIRFRMSSDVLTPAEGWYIDDILIAEGLTFVENTAYYTATDGLHGEASVTTLINAGNAAVQVAPLTQTGLPAAPAINGSSAGEMTATVHPNPARSTVTITAHQLATGETSLSVINAQGQVMHTQRWYNEDANQQRPLDVTALPAGMYWIRLQNASQTELLPLNVNR